MRIALFAAGLVIAYPAAGQVTQQQARCRVLAGPAEAMTKAVAELSANTSRSNIEAEMRLLEGAPLAAAKRVEAARVELTAKLTAYLNALQDMDYALKVCAR